MDVQDMLNDVCRARNDLAALAVDESVTPERFAKCEASAADLEAIVTELLTTAWVPSDPVDLLATIQCVTKNLRNVERDIDAALDAVLLDRKPDELYRAFIAVSFARLLEFQLSVLCDALVNCMKCPCGCGAFVPEGWTN